MCSVPLVDGIYSVQCTLFKTNLCKYKIISFHYSLPKTCLKDYIKSFNSFLYYIIRLGYRQFSPHVQVNSDFQVFTLVYYCAVTWIQIIINPCNLTYTHFDRYAQRWVRPVRVRSTNSKNSDRYVRILIYNTP